MAAISQNIPNYGIGGISEQPDQLKLKGTVKDVENAIPDVVWGLYKRPGSKRLKREKITGDSGFGKKWFSYYRDQTEGAYIGHIDVEGRIRIWSCLNGAEKDVKYNKYNWTAGDSYGDTVGSPTTYNASEGDHTAIRTSSVDSKATISGDWGDFDGSGVHTNYGYLATTNPKDLSTLTINDTTFISNQDKPIRLHKNTGPQPYKFWSYVQLLRTENGRQYSLNIYEGDGGTTKPVPSATHIRIHSDDLEEGNGTGTCPGIGTQTFYVNAFSSGQTSGANHVYTGADALRAGVMNVYDEGENDGTGMITEKWVMKGDKVTGGQLVNTSAGRSNLCFKITVQGQQGQKEDKASTSSEAGDDYQCSYNRQITLLSGGEGWVTTDTCRVKFSDGHSKGGASTSAGNWTDANKAPASFKIEILEHETVSHKANIRAVRPVPTPFDRDTAVSVDAILGGMSKAITSGTGNELKGTGWEINHVIIGNGIYFYSNDKDFKIDILDEDLMRVTQGDVNDVSKLPLQCRDGSIIKVTNTEDSEVDDYYVKFHCFAGTNGAGSWKECAKPSKWNLESGSYVERLFHTQLNRSTMPHILQRQSGGDFLIKKYDWAMRECGDDFTNPPPSFVSFEDNQWDHTWVNEAGDNVGKLYPADVANVINGCYFFRNRLVLLSKENAICSQPGSITLPNYWADTALTVSSIDPVDIACASKFPADLQTAIETPSGLVCFSNNSQFLLHSDEAMFTPESAKFTNISNYKYNTDVPPVSLGTSVVFLDDSHDYTKVLELVNISRETEPQIRDVTQLVPRLIAKDQNLLAVSNENNLLFVGKGKSDGAATGSNIVYVCKFFPTPDGQTKRPSWSKWVFKEPMYYFFVAANDFYYLDTDMILQKISLVHNTDNDLLATGTEVLDSTSTVKYQLNLDGWYSTGSALAANKYEEELAGYTEFGTYAQINDETNFAAADNNSVPDNFCLLDKTTGNYITGADNGIMLHSGNELRAKGDWTGNANLVWGHLYDYKVVLPTIYPVAPSAGGEGQIADIKSPLTLHRLNLNFGKVGSYKTTVNKLGKDTYEDIWEQPIADLYEGDAVPYMETDSRTIPIYEKNQNTKVTLTSTNPSPATLHSMSWEGSYTPKFYQKR